MAVILWSKFLAIFYQLVYIAKQVLNITFALSGLLVFSLIYLMIVNVYFTASRAFNASSINILMHWLKLRFSLIDILSIFANSLLFIVIENFLFLSVFGILPPLCFFVHRLLH
jgi:hypothetical protein